MSEYTDAIRVYFENIAQTAKNTTDPHRRAIAENYLQHVALEATPRWTEIFSATPRLIVDHPVYRIQYGGQFEIFDGVDEVTQHYTQMQSSVVMLKDETLFINDWGIASYSTFMRFADGDSLVAEGMSIDNPKGTYVQSFPLGMFWRYTEDAILISECVYQCEPAQVKEIDPADALTLEQRVLVVEPFLDY